MALGYYSGGEFRAMIKLAHTWISRCVAEAYPNWPNADYTWVLAPIAAATSSARTKIICFLPSKLMISCYPVNHPKCSMHGTRLSMKGEFNSRPQYACPVHAERYFLVFFPALCHPACQPIICVQFGILPIFINNTTANPYAELRPVFPRGRQRRAYFILPAIKAGPREFFPRYILHHGRVQLYIYVAVVSRAGWQNHDICRTSPSRV